MAGIDRRAILAQIHELTEAVFVTEPYFEVNAFLFTNRDGKARFSVTF